MFRVHWDIVQYLIVYCLLQWPKSFFKEAVITSSVAMIIFVMTEITFKVAVITSSVHTISLFVCGQDHLCGG